MTTDGVTAAVRDYINKKWEELSFFGIDNHKLNGLEDVSLTIQRNFTGVGTYHFIGSARPQLSDGLGGHIVDNYTISGTAEVSINQEGDLYVKGINRITLKKSSNI